MRKRKKRIIFLFLSLLSFFTIYLPIYGYSGQQERAPKIIQHEVTVTLKLIQVFVTDKRGNPVTDLEKGDFSIFDNGKRVDITEFERHFISLPPVKPEVSAEIIQETKITSSRESLNRKFFLLFDFANNNPKGILKAKNAALHFINTRLLPADEVAVLSYSALRGLKIHEFLTRDHEKVREFLAAIGMKEIGGRAENLEEQFWREITKTNPADASEGAEEKFQLRGMEEAIESERFLKLEDTLLQAVYFIQRMTDLARALRYIPGFKYIILFSSGLPYSLMYGVKAPFGEIGYDGSWGNSLLRIKYEEMLKELTASNSIVYTLDTEDMATKIKSDSRMTGAPTLQQIASSTGGKYFGNINRYEQHVREIQKITSCYYVLGYYIDEKWDGKYHTIKVEVNRPGCKVYAQKGYFNPKPYKEYTNLEKMLHLVDLALSESPHLQTPLRFSLKAFPYLSKGKQNLVLWAKVEKEKIQELAGKKVEAVMLLFGEEENIVKMERREINLSTLPAGSIYFTSFLLALQPGEYKCRLVIRSLESGRGAVASSSVFVPEPPAERLRLYPPLFLKAGKDGPSVQLSHTSTDFLFDTSKYTPLIEELERETESLLACVQCFYAGIQNPEIKLRANLLQIQADTTTSLSVSTSILERKRQDDTEIFFLKIQTEALEPGKYLLYLIAEELTTGSIAQANSSFTVK